MRKKIVQNFSIYEDQLIDLRKISKKHNGQFMSTFVRYWLDYGIKQESTKSENIDYT